MIKAILILCIIDLGSILGIVLAFIIDSFACTHSLPLTKREKIERKADKKIKKYREKADLLIWKTYYNGQPGVDLHWKDSE